MRIAIIIGSVYLFSCSNANIKNFAPVKVKVPKIFDEIMVETQRYSFDPRFEQKIKCRYGSEIFIPKDAFRLPYDFNEGDSIDFDVKEYTKKLDFLSAGYSLTFMENDSIKGLESGGMLSLKAYYKDTELSLRENLSIRMPNKNPKVSYNVYKVSNNIWEHAGHNSQIAQDTIEFSESYDRLSKVYSEFLRVDELTLWNFDNPIGNSCFKYELKGVDVSSKSPIFYSVLSNTNLRVNFKWDYFPSLKIMVPVSDSVNLIFWHDNKLSILKDIRTPDSPLGDKVYPNNEVCQNLGDVKLEFQSDEFFQEPASRQRFLYSR